LDSTSASVAEWVGVNPRIGVWAAAGSMRNRVRIERMGSFIEWDFRVQRVPQAAVLRTA